jgi:hypothetical protein
VGPGPVIVQKRNIEGGGMLTKVERERSESLKYERSLNAKENVKHRN